MQCPSEAFDREVGPLDIETLQWLCYNTEARIRSRCCGLIEVHKKSNANQLNGLTVKSEDLLKNHTGESQGGISDVDVTSTIDYLHRTVAEFLVSDDVWKEICGMTSDSNFDPPFESSMCLSLLDENRV